MAVMLTTLTLLTLAGLRPDDATRARAEQSLDRLFTADDYPTEALRQGTEGNVRFELRVDATGRVETCKILVSSNSELLDRATCDILRTRARFTPARDAHGKAVADTVTNDVRWRIESGPLMPFELTRLGATVAMTSAGLRCTPLGDLAEMTPRLEGEACAAAMGPFAAIAQAGGDGTELNLQARLVPDGERDPGGVADGGLVLLDAEADLVIGPDGRVMGCEVRRMELTGMFATGASPPDPCIAGMARARFEPAADDRPRTGRLHMAISINRSLEI